GISQTLRNGDRNMARTRRLKVAVGPRRPDNGSWRWIGESLAERLPRWYEVRTYGMDDYRGLRDADVVLVVKQRILESLFAAAPHARVIYAPVDGIPGPEWLTALAAEFRRCRALVAHSHRLVPLLAEYAPARY